MQQSLRMRTKRFRAKSTGSIDNVDVQRDGRIFPTPPRSQLPSRAAEHKLSVPTSTSPGVTRKLRGIGAQLRQVFFNFYKCKSQSGVVRELSGRRWTVWRGSLVVVPTSLP